MPGRGLPDLPGLAPLPPPCSPTGPLQRRKLPGVAAGQPPDEFTVRQHPCHQSGQDSAFEHCESLCASVFGKSCGAAKTSPGCQSVSREQWGAAGIGHEHAERHGHRMEPGLGPGRSGGEGRCILPSDKSAFRMTYPHSCDSVRDNRARSPKMASDGYRQLSRIGRLRV